MQTVTLNDVRDLQDVYDNISEDFALIDYREYLYAELPKMEDFHKQRFATQTDANGQAWAKNAPRTIREKGHSRILRGKPSEGFRLSRSLANRHRNSTEDAVREVAQLEGRAYLGFGSTRPYAAIQQFGTPKIPARPHTGLNEKHVDGMVDRVADYTVKKLAES